MGFKRKDVQKCLLCGKGIAHNWMNPTFYRVSLERFILNMRNIQSQAGLEQYFGGGGAGAVLADVMGADEDLATSPGVEIKSFLVCGDCAGIGADENDDDTPIRPSIDAMADKVYERNRPDDEGGD